MTIQISTEKLAKKIGYLRNEKKDGFLSEDAYRERINAFYLIFGEDFVDEAIMLAINKSTTN